MTKRNGFVAFALAALLMASGSGVQAQSERPAPALGAFDYYVFTLSWSPGFCDTGGASKSPQQCATGANQGFVVHGLWPDSAYGPNPEDCGTGAAPSEADLDLTRGLYPTTGLARYEYLKHGTCAGLGPTDYFNTVRYVREQFTVPEALRAPHEAQRMAPADIQQAFIAANPNLTAASFAVTCSHGELEDVRFCVTKDLKAFALCPKVAGHSCYARSIAVSPLR